jgi:transposase
MTVKREVENEIRVLFFGEHLPVGTVASQLHVHDDAVKRVIGLFEPRPPQPPRPRKVDSVKDFIIETLERYPRLRATRLYDMVKPRGYSGAVRTLRRYVSEIRPPPRREAFLRLTPLIGQQAQVDWAHVGEVDVPGGRRALWLFVMSLPWSRAMWGEFVLDLTVWSLLRSLSRACTYFGGTAREWLFDNPKIVVLERHGDAARFHPLLLDLAGHYAVRLRLCAVRAANQKGGVERLIRYIRERFLAGRVIRSVEQGNREFLVFLDEVAHARAHPTFASRTVRDCLEEERTRLLPLPAVPPVTDQVIPARVDKTASCRFDTNSYSVGPEHVAKTLTLVADDREVRLLDGAALVARHSRCWGRRQPVETREHREALLARRPGAREAKGRDRLKAAVPAIDALYERWVDAGRNLGSMTARTLRLLDLYGAELLASAVEEVISRGLHDPGALAALCEQRRCARAAPVPLDVPLPSHVRDRDVVPHDLETYDAKPR